jgi:glycosyltransferase involved in cell wall biosynthesis
MEKELIRVLGIERDKGGCNHYRIVQPLYKLLNHKLANILTIHEGNAFDPKFVTEKMIEANILVIHRPADEKWFKLIKVAQKYGKFIVADYDDDPFNTSPWNPSYRWYGIQEVSYKNEDGTEIPLWIDGENGFSIETNVQRRDTFRATFKNVDMVSVTTDILKDTFSKINKNTVVLPNLIDTSLFCPLEMKKTKEVRIGYTFGYSHYEDFYMVSKHLKSLVKKHANVKLVFLGDSGFHGLFKDVPEDRIEWHNWTSNAVYPWKLRTLNLDIGICPIVDNVFNHNKSSIKWMEFSALRIPTIASDVPPYNVSITNGKDGLLVKEDDWEFALTELVLNKKMRNKIGKNAYDNILEKHNADKSAYLWLDAYEGLLKKDIIET